MGIIMVIGTTISEFFTLFVVSGTFFDQKIDKKNLVHVFPTFYCCSSFLWLVLPYFGVKYIKIGACLLGLSIILTLFYKGAFFEKLFLSIVYFVYLYVLDYTVMGLVIILNGHGVAEIQKRLPVWVVGSILTKSVLLLLGTVVLQSIKHTKVKSKHFVLYCMQMLLIPCCMFLNLGLILFYICREQQIPFWAWVDVVALIAGNLLFLFLEQKLEKEWETRMENQALIRLSSEAKQKAELMEASYNEQRKMTHDFRNHLLTIQGLITEKHEDVAEKYLASLLKEESLQSEVVHSNHPAMDAILNRAYQEAAKQGVLMEFDINDLTKIEIPQEDLTILLSNLLDNAVEAARQLETYKRVIVRLIQRKKEFLISIRNTSNHSDICDLHEFFKIYSKDTQNYEHGFGIKNALRIVKKYHGVYAGNCKNGWFQITIIFGTK